LPRAKQNPYKTGKCCVLVGAALLTIFGFVALVLPPLPFFLGVFPMIHKGVSLYRLSDLPFLVKSALGKTAFLKTPSIFGPWDLFCPFGTVAIYRTSYWAELFILIRYSHCQLRLLHVIECRTRHIFVKHYTVARQHGIYVQVQQADLMRFARSTCGSSDSSAVGLRQCGM
jgi:hypothetical protein